MKKVTLMNMKMMTKKKMTKKTRKRNFQKKQENILNFKELHNLKL